MLTAGIKATTTTSSTTNKLTALRPFLAPGSSRPPQMNHPHSHNSMHRRTPHDQLKSQSPTTPPPLRTLLSMIPRKKTGKKRKQQRTANRNREPETPRHHSSSRDWSRSPARTRPLQSDSNRGARRGLAGGGENWTCRHAGFTRSHRKREGERDYG